jgi:hypothetical protein
MRIVRISGDVISPQRAHMSNSNFGFNSSQRQTSFREEVNKRCQRSTHRPVKPLAQIRLIGSSLLDA